MTEAINHQGSAIPPPERPALVPVPTQMLEESEPVGTEGRRAGQQTTPNGRSIFWQGWLPHTLLEQAEVLMRLVIIGAALFSIHQYMSHTHSERVKRTIDYIDRFEVGEISRSYTNIVSVLNLSSDFVARSIERDLAADAQEEIFSQVVLAVVLDFKHDKGKGIAIDLDSVIGFIGGLQICVDQSLCDERLSRAFFGATAQRLYENFRPYILWRRQTDPNYGTQFEKFAAHASAT